MASPVLLIVPRNCESTTGLPWRRVVRFGDAHGLRKHRIGRSYAFLADDLLAALRAEDAPANEADPVDPAEAVRRKLGLRRRDG
jgi:hypothetical protein